MLKMILRIIKRLLITLGTAALITYLLHKKTMPVDIMVYFTQQIVPEPGLLNEVYNKLIIAEHMTQVQALASNIHTLSLEGNSITTLMKYKLRLVETLSELAKYDLDMTPSQRGIVETHRDSFNEGFEKRLKNTLNAYSDATSKRNKLIGAVAGVLATVGFGISFYFFPVSTATGLFSSLKNLF